MAISLIYAGLLYRFTLRNDTLPISYIKFFYIMEADMLKNPCNSTGFYLNTHGCIFQLVCLSAKGWLASSRSLRSLPPQRIRRGGQASLFQHVYLPFHVRVRFTFYHNDLFNSIFKKLSVLSDTLNLSSPLYPAIHTISFPLTTIGTASRSSLGTFSSTK